MNTSAKGSSYDNAILAVLRAHGYEGMRSSASLGEFDVHVWGHGKSGYFQDKAGVLSCAGAERLVQTLSWPVGATDVAVIHHCRKGCRYDGHVPQAHCMHSREPPDAV